MISEISALEPRLKEILYRCLEQVRATKAALYMIASADPTEKLFELVTQYGFGEKVRKQFTSEDATLERLVVRRVPFYLNGISADPAFSELLFSNGTDRILMAPVYARGRLVGIVDMRDKAGKQPFVDADVETAKAIVDAILEVLKSRKLFHLAAIEMTEPQPRSEIVDVRVQMRDLQPAGSAAGRPGPLAPQPAEAAPARQGRGGQSAATIIDEARAVVARYLAHQQWSSATLTEDDLAPLKQCLPTILFLKGAIAAAVTAYGHAGNLQMIAATTLLHDTSVATLNEKLTAWMRKRGEAEQKPRTEIDYPFGTAKAPILPAHIASVLSAPVATGLYRGIVLSVAFETPPDSMERHQLEMFLRQAEQTIEHAVSHNAMQASRQAVAEMLLEPDFEHYPDLAEHGRAVSALARNFASWLGLLPAECETIRIAALVHNVGLRLLYPLFKTPRPTPEERQILQQHTVIGAALVTPVLGREIGGIVLTHHEQPDGRGYPNGLAGEQIPLAARIIRICDAFVAAETHNINTASKPKSAAIELIQRGAGAEFDATLAEKFCRMMSGS